MSAAIAERFLDGSFNAAAWRAGNSARLLPRGTSEVYIDPRRAELGLGTRPEDRERNNQTIGRNRQRGHLENEFFGHTVGESSATRRYGGATLLDRGRLVVVGQPAGYTEQSALIVATDLSELTPEELALRRGETVLTRYPTELFDHTRLAYVAAKLASLQTVHERVTEGNKKDFQKPLIIEHLTPEVKTDDVSYPRSVPWIHASVLNFDLDTIDRDNRKDIPHLDAEQATMAMYPEFNAVLSAYMHTYLRVMLGESDFADDVNRIDVHPRAVEPLGYGITLDIKPEDLTDSENVHFVTAVLDVEHAALAELEGTTFWRKLPPYITTSTGQRLDRKPGPATRGYTHINRPEGVLEKVSSLNAWSHAGGVEAAGVVLRRGSGFERRHDPAEIEVFRKEIGNNVEQTIADMGIAGYK